jgi:hypothetical protein
MFDLDDRVALITGVEDPVWGLSQPRMASQAASPDPTRNIPGRPHDQ